MTWSNFFTCILKLGCLFCVSITTATIWYNNYHNIIRYYYLALCCIFPLTRITAVRVIVFSNLHSEKYNYISSDSSGYVSFRMFRLHPGSILLKGRLALSRTCVCLCKTVYTGRRRESIRNLCGGKFYFFIAKKCKVLPYSRAERHGCLHLIFKTVFGIHLAA